LIYQVLEEENVDQKSLGPPGWGLMQRARSSLVVKKQETLKNQTPNNQTECVKYVNIISHGNEFFEP